uniref:Uncharacterized protein n=1 Tax=Glossina pallidipes TaxID=7398 RepID=A0A1A9Z759_GLOPL
MPQQHMTTTPTNQTNQTLYHISPYEMALKIRIKARQSSRLTLKAILKTICFSIFLLFHIKSKFLSIVCKKATMDTEPVAEFDINSMKVLLRHCSGIPERLLAIDADECEETIKAGMHDEKVTILCKAVRKTHPILFKGKT